MQLISPISCENFMQSRLGALCLQSIDVGVVGDCFFRSVSHQLYDNSNHHMHIRSAGVQFMRDNPERLYESFTNPTPHSFVTLSSTTILGLGLPNKVMSTCVLSKRELDVS